MNKSPLPAYVVLVCGYDEHKRPTLFLAEDEKGETLRFSGNDARAYADAMTEAAIQSNLSRVHRTTYYACHVKALPSGWKRTL